MGNRSKSQSAFATLALVAVMAGASVADEHGCETGEAIATDEYATCLAKAEKTFVFRRDRRAYDDAMVRCAAEYRAARIRLGAAANTNEAECRRVDAGPLPDDHVSGLVDSTESPSDPKLPQRVADLVQQLPVLEPKPGP